MNSGSVTPPLSALEKTSACLPSILADLKLDSKPLPTLTIKEALDLTTAVIGYYLIECRKSAYLVPTQFTPWHHEKEYIETAVKEADPANLVTSVIQSFTKSCHLDVPF